MRQVWKPGLVSPAAAFALAKTLAREKPPRVWHMAHGLPTDRTGQGIAPQGGIVGLKVWPVFTHAPFIFSL